MRIVTSHAAPTPMTSTQSNHEWKVGSGSKAAWYRSKANAAATDTTNCIHCMAGA